MSKLPITFDLGWWSISHFTTKELQVEVLQHGNMIKNDGKIRVIIGGIAFSTEKQILKSIHVSQQFKLINNEQIGLIIITPIVNSCDDTALLLPGIPVTETLELNIKLWQWGINKLKIISGDIEKIIEIKQQK